MEDSVVFSLSESTENIKDSSIYNSQEYNGIRLAKTAEEGKGEAEDPEKNKNRAKKAGLKPIIVRGTRIKKKKDIQSISRQTMTAEEMKEVPGSFGDSVNALTSLPGIIHAYGGFFGPLVIRGADPSSNNYFIDDIPIDNPLHFGGLHSVINTNLIKDIDVYSSSFPADFGSATAAIINITTIDEVNRFSGYTDINFLSSSALIRAPILRGKSGDISTNTPSYPESEEETKNAGYFIASGRYGNLGPAIKLVDYIRGTSTPFSIEYWDYQVKAKYRIDNVNSISALLFGHGDYIRAIAKKRVLEEGSDPLLTNAQFQSDVTSHNGGLYLDSKFTGDFSNRLMYYNSLPDTHRYLNLSAQGAASWAKDVDSHSKPWVFGLRDKVNIIWLDGHSQLTGSPEYTLYYFTIKGKIISPSGAIHFDAGDPEAFMTKNVDETIINHKIGGYLENKFTFGGYTFTPGFRSEYLARTAQTTYDPRGMMSYRFQSNTTISAAGGHYSNFFQTNPFLFNQDADLASISNRDTKPEKAWHASLGAEQELGLFTLKLEGFNNYFYDMPEAYAHYEPDGSLLPGISSGQLKARGFEVMIRKDSRENENDLFGWLSYTYTQSRFKSGLPTGEYYKGVQQTHIGDEYGDTWISSDFEQRHSVKLVAGYKLGGHTFSTKFQYYSGFPYTPIVGMREDLPEPDPYGRFTPKYGKTNSRYFPAYWQLDLRYSYKITHSWGYISWYFEIINLFASQDYEYKWYWDRAYSSGSNPVLRKQNGFSVLPNFGVEVKF